MATKTTAAKALEKFGDLRDKAIKKGLASAVPTIVTDDDYVLGEDLGFTPEIRIPAPSLEKLIVFQETVNSQNSLAIAQAILGVAETTAIVRNLDERFGVNDAEQFFVGIVLDAVEHFFGDGAGDVNGGFSN